MHKTTKFVFLTFISLLMLGSGMIASAQKTASGLVVCGNVSEGGQVKESEMCKYADLIEQARTVINFLIFDLAAPLAALMFAYAGFLYVTNGGNEGRIREAHEIFWNVFIGLIIALSAWLLVNFFLSFLLGEGSAFNFLGT